MNDATRDDHYNHIHEGTIPESDTATNDIAEQGLVAESLEENDWEVYDQVSDDDNYDLSSDDKPDFDDAGLLGRKFGGAKVTSEGPQVEYVNRALGVDATEYTLETAHAVKRYQSENKLKPTGRVNADLYDRL